MSGRHIPVSAPEPRRRWVLVVAAVLVVTGVVSAVLVTGMQRDGSSSPAGAATPCAHSVTLNVLASPAIAKPIQQVATDWVASSGAPLRNGCLHVTVTPRDDAAAEAELASGAAGATTTWIPDSTIWAERLASDLARAGAPTSTMTVGGSVASSPIVFVAPAAPTTTTTTTATTISPAALASSAAAGKAPFSVPDPLTNAEGVLSLQLLRSLTPGTSAPSPSVQSMRNLIGLMIVLGPSTIDSPQAGYAKAGGTAARQAVKPFAASEQSVVAANASAGHPVANAVYPAGGVESLDFPALQISRTGDDPLLTSTAATFGKVLAAVTAQRVFADYGFRDPQGDPIAGASSAGTGSVGTATVHTLPAPSADDTAGILRLWSAATEASHTLAVIDVSGSMADPAGNGRSKIQVAATAAAGAVSYFPDTSAFGLWAFSSGKANGLPYQELAPLKPLGDHTGAATQRQALTAAAAELPTVVGGSTALYDTALAAFEDVRNTYDPSMVNSVVLLTDGKNEYPQGLTLTQLLTKLRTLADPARPVPIITVGIGNQADVPTLRQISAATGGKTYVVRNPAEIRDVFLDAMLQRECRPDCAGN
jgi:Ca-activated chloride channel homolog